MKRVVVWGCGKQGSQLLRHLDELSIRNFEVVGLADSYAEEINLRNFIMMAIEFLGYIVQIEIKNL